MDIEEVLKFADELVLAKTGKHLDNLQQVILVASWQGKRYSHIAKEFYCTERHIANVASKLWQLLSERLDENVTKSNFRPAMKRHQLYHYSNFLNHNFLEQGDINFCTETSHNLESSQKSSSPQTSNKDDNRQKLQFDLKDAPEIRAFCGREIELATMQNQLLEQRCRLIILLGFRGIGKTTLTLQLVEQVKSQFDYIIYRSLYFAPTPETTINNLLQVFSPTEISQDITTQLSQLLDYLRKYRCLIILDDVQMLFTREQLAGHYQNGLENYQRLFTLAAEVNHNSCLLLNSSEKPREITNLEKDNQYCFSLVLESLGNAGIEILRKQNLADESSWINLIQIYKGNPLWLKFTANLIQELCGGGVARFCSLRCRLLVNLCKNY
ncbi:MAG: AAA family ATPase [Richelia sp. SM2_1_7]|nr:AAA family ATPase [Richelia sp. SM2_1_7]